MGAPAIPPPTPRQFATTAQAQAGTDPNTLMSPALVLALVLAQMPAALRAVHASLPTAPDGLQPGDAWADRDAIFFIPNPPST